MRGSLSNDHHFQGRPLAPKLPNSDRGRVQNRAHGHECWGHDPHKNNLIYLHALVNGQGRLWVLCSRRCTESRVKKIIRRFAVTNDIECKEVTTSTHVFQEKKGKLEQGSRIQGFISKGNEGRVRQILSSRWFELNSPFQASIL